MSSALVNDNSSGNSASLRRHWRETRSRPWLTNSVLRKAKRSETTSTLDAPKVVEVSQVTAAPESRACQSVSEASEKESGSTKGKLPKAVAKVATSVKTAARSAGSKIPVWVGFPRVFSRASSQAPDGAAGVKMEKAATKKAVGTGAGKFSSLVSFFRPANTSAGCFKEGPIRSHREGVQPRSILKGSSQCLVDIKLLPETSAGYGVMSRPRKAVKWRSVIKVRTPPRPWKHTSNMLHDCCGELQCLECEEDREEVISGEAWLKEQRGMGHDYLKGSRGLFGGIVYSDADLTF